MLDAYNVNIDETFFSFKVIEEWNGFPETVVNSHTVDTFKRNLTVILGIEIQISFDLLSSCIPPMGGR